MIIDSTIINKDLTDVKCTCITSAGVITVYSSAMLIAFQRLHVLDNNPDALQLLIPIVVVGLSLTPLVRITEDITRYITIIKYLKCINEILDNDDITVNMDIKEQLKGVSDTTRLMISYSSTLKHNLSYIDNLWNKEIPLADLKIIFQNVKDNRLNAKQKVLGTYYRS
jgi:hypothetical protein